MARRNPKHIDLMPDWEATLGEGARAMGVTLDGRAVDRFRCYALLLQKWGRQINLTSRLEPEEIISLHFLDSLSLLAVRAPGEDDTLVDIGSGAGFPGLPLGIVLPDLPITLLEPSARKADFCRTVVHQLALSRVTVVRGRAQDFADVTAVSRTYRWAVSRAIAPLSELLRLAAGLTGTGGTLASYKGPDDVLSPNEASALAALWHPEGRSLVTVPGKASPRAILFFRRQ